MASRLPGSPVEVVVDPVTPSRGMALLEAARRGSPQAWDAVYRHFGPALTRYARSRGVGDPEDVTQEVMYAAAARIDRFTGDWQQLRSWLFSIAYRRCADHHRRRFRRPEQVTDDLPDRPDPEGGADEPLWSDGAAREVITALQVLDERERRIVTMRVIGELPVADVAVATGLSASNIRVIQSRALAKLRRHVENNGGVLDKRFRGLGLPLLPGLWHRFRSLAADRLGTAAGGSIATASVTSGAAGPVVAGAAASLAMAVTVTAAVIVPPAVTQPPVDSTAPPATTADHLEGGESQALPAATPATTAVPDDALAADDPIMPADPPASSVRETEGRLTAGAGALIGASRGPALLESTGIVDLGALTEVVEAVASLTILDLPPDLDRLINLEPVGAVVEQAVDGVRRTVDSVEQQVGQTAAVTVETVEGVTEEVEEVVVTVEDAAGAVEGVASEVGQGTEDVVATVSTATEGVVEMVEQTATGAVETVEDTAEEAGEAVGDLVGGLGSLLGG